MSGTSSAAAQAIRPGRHAHTQVDLDAVASPGAPVELGLAAPFGALLSALFEQRSYRVSQLSLEYVAPGPLTAWATFSAKLSELREPGEATVSLLVFRGPLLFVRGQASVLLTGGAAVSTAGANGKSSSHLNGESR